MGYFAEKMGQCDPVAHYTRPTYANTQCNYQLLDNGEKSMILVIIATYYTYKYFN